MNKFLKLIAAVAVSSVSLAVNAQGIVLQDEVRVAFYEAAPSSLAASMQRAIDNACKGHEKDKGYIGATQPLSWLCSGASTKFFRGVDVLGNKRQTGIACASTAVTPNLKYYTEDMFTDEAECVGLSYDVKSKTHSLDTASGE